MPGFEMSFFKKVEGSLREESSTFLFSV